MVNGKKYKNVIAVFQQEFEETIIIGAHYDVCENQTGADDNASGTVGLLEIARQLKDQKLKKRVELVAFTLEEPPFFRSEYMGSFIHAKSMKENNRNVIGMICLEMIGYFDDSKNSQEYPIEALKLKYGNRGDFITLVNRINQGEFSSEFTKNYVELSKIKTKKFSGPKSLQGIDFSDHLNYWKFGYSALMITDTAFFRNKNYHQKTDTLDTLDLPRMALVIDGVIETLLHLYR
ncbi:MAG: peptidase M28 [Flavobacteriales bacterium]|nr:peptidase M28 [Flavobacteriales bacterium]